MSDTHPDPRHRPHSAAMAGSYLEFDLPAEIHRFRAETTWSTGHNARTLIKYDHLRVVLIALQEYASIPEHKAEDRISVHVLSGHIQLRAAGRTFSLRPMTNHRTLMRMNHHHTRDEERRIREAALDETLADSFPASDPPSTVPNPDDDSVLEPRPPARPAPPGPTRTLPETT